MDELEALRRENAALRDQVTRVVEQNTQLIEQLARLNERVAELLAVAQRKQRKLRERPPAPPPPPPLVEGEERRAFEERPKAPEKPTAEAAVKKKAKPTGRKPLPRHLEAEEHELRPDSCSHCGGAALDVADELVEEKLHVVKEHQRRRVVRRYTCRCRACGGRTTLRSLPAPYERSKVTCEWLAWFVYQKFWLLTPLDRIRRDLGERGIPLAMGTLVSFIERAADLLSGIDGLHWKKLRASRWMATDGTGLKVIVPKLPAAHNGYIEIYRNDELAVFQYEPDKSGDVVATKLRPFRGTLTADAEHRFNDVFASGSVLEAGCNAHGRRKFRDAEATQPVLAAEGGAFIGAMYGEEEKAQKLGLRDDALLAHRQRHIRPIANDFVLWLDAVKPTLLPSEPLAAAIGYYKRHSDALFRFVDDPLVPIDNSPTEREFQNVAKLRLNMLFAGSTEGAHRALRPARHHRHLSRVAHPRAGIPGLGLRAPRHPPRRFRPPARSAHPGRLQEIPRLAEKLLRPRPQGIPASLIGHSARLDQCDRFDEAWALVAATYERDVRVLANVVDIRPGHRRSRARARHDENTVLHECVPRVWSVNEHDFMDCGRLHEAKVSIDLGVTGRLVGV